MRNSITLTSLSLFIMAALITGEKQWLTKKSEKYTVYYKASDKSSIKSYLSFLSKGTRDVHLFFDTAFQKKFDVYVHHNRASLDSTWAKDWGSPGFRSECWMVASGVATRMDLLSPATWDALACEHSYRDKKHVQQVITHELVHIFHGQQNTSGDFSNVENIDWFVEGLATYASGQCDEAKLAEVRKAIAANTIPATLDSFWTGKLKYALSGSVVMYIDKKYGRGELKKLLTCTKKQQILDTLGISEATLLSGWNHYLKKM